MCAYMCTLILLTQQKNRSQIFEAKESDLSIRPGFKTFHELALEIPFSFIWPMNNHDLVYHTLVTGPGYILVIPLPMKGHILF